MKVVDLFCGGGGLSLGFMMAGHDVIAAYDADPVAVATHNTNLGEHAHVADIRSMNGKDLPECDAIIGGPPCQALSNGNQINGGWSSERNLVPKFVEIVLGRMPKVFVMENVMGLLNYESELAELMKLFFKAGYLVSKFQVDAADYGVPQNRKRIFFIGSRSFVTFPAPTHKGNPVSARRAIEHLLEEEEEVPNFMKMFVGSPDKMVHPSNRKTDSKSNKELYWRDFDRPSFTVLARSAGGSVARVIIGNRSYPMYAKQNAALQSYPDWYKFPTVKHDSTRIIGNSVPPRLAYRIGSCFEK
jgi:DNA (cytosine-5)-methyltransferase 1